MKPNKIFIDSGSIYWLEDGMLMYTPRCLNGIADLTEGGLVDEAEMEHESPGDYESITRKLSE